MTKSSEPATLLAALPPALAARDRARAVAIVDALLAADTDLGAKWLTLARLSAQHGELRAMRDALARHAVATGDDPRALFDHAALLAQSGDPAAAMALLDTLPAHVPDPLGRAYLTATLAMTLGDLPRARAALDRAIGHHSASGQAWLLRAQLDPTDPDLLVAALRAQPALTNAPVLERASHAYAVGTLQAARAAHGAAFDAFADGARLIAGVRPFDARGDAARCRQIMDDWSIGAVASLRRLVAADGGIDAGSAAGAARRPPPIFVTGLPRSGTTLVEQRLAAHPAVDGGDELGLWRQVELTLGGAGPDALARWLAAGGDPAAPGALYRRLVDERLPGTGHVVDKSLSTPRQMGLVATLLPDAPLVWVRRDPEDCGWSAFRTWFAHGIDWSWDQEATGAHVGWTERLLAHWQAVLGDRLLVIDYAELVADPDGQTARLMAHVGLSIDPAQRQAHTLARPVTTASVMQVRQPVHTRAIGAAAPYRDRLAPMRAAYAAAISGA